MVMKKLFFSMVLVFMALMNVNAQDVQLATLQKTDGLQVFYGADAFKEAMEAADHGDVITLTAGSFNATTITKAVSIYGAGYEMDAKMKTTETDQEIITTDNELPKYPTRLVGDFNIVLDSIGDQPAEGLYIEGIYSNNSIFVGSKLVSASFVKCRFQNFAIWKDTRTMMESKDCLLFQCRVAEWLEPGLSQAMTISNCVVNNLGRNNDSSAVLVQNSFIRLVVNAFRGIIKNSVIKSVMSSDQDYHYETGSERSLHPNCSSIYNLFGCKPSLDEVITKDGNWIDLDYSATLFGHDGSIWYSDTYMYELTDEAKTTYLGTDGKEIGLYGGANPFSPILTIPRVVKKDIAAQTADGKLKVNIKVETGDSSF